MTMPRLVMELTNRCNLRCRHCFAQRHAATGELPLGIVERVLSEARACGIDHVSFTGGEPTLHSRFPDIIERCAHTACTFSFVSNGSTFPAIYRLLLAHRALFGGVTFSLDGAREETHDRLRGAGSYRQVMRAASICHFTALPFTFNMVVTAENRGEMAELVELTPRLGSAGVRFGFLMPGSGVDCASLELSPSDRRNIEATIRNLRQNAHVAVEMAPGYYSESPFFPCGPLEQHEFNVDWRGNMTLCCQLSGYWGDRQGTPDVIGNLNDMSVQEARALFHRRVSTYLSDKHARVASGAFTELDHFPCRYCVNYLAGEPQVVTIQKRAVNQQEGHQP